MLVRPTIMANIKKNSFVGIASMKDLDDTLNAPEVLICPEAARGRVAAVARTTTVRR
jgi:hypothetical protein